MTSLSTPRDGGKAGPRHEIALDPTLSTASKAIYLVLIALGGEATYESLARSGLKGSSLQRAVRPLEDRSVVERARLDNRTWVVRLVTADYSDPCSPGCSDERSPDHTLGSQPITSDQSRPCSKYRTSRSSLQNTSLPTDAPLIRDLMSQGVWASTARRLAAEHEESLIRAWIEQAQLWGGDLRNRGGWIRSALDGHWVLPVPVITDLSPQEIAKRLSEAVWYSSSPEDRRDILHEAKAVNGEVCRQARQIATWVPQWRPGLDATIGVEWLRRNRFGLMPEEART
jgi:hypothetical protein